MAWYLSFGRLLLRKYTAIFWFLELSIFGPPKLEKRKQKSSLSSPCEGQRIVTFRYPVEVISLPTTSFEAGFAASRIGLRRPEPAKRLSAFHRSIVGSYPGNRVGRYRTANRRVRPRRRCRCIAGFSAVFRADQPAAHWLDRLTRLRAPASA